MITQWLDCFTITQWFDRLNDDRINNFNVLKTIILIRFISLNSVLKMKNRIFIKWLKKNIRIFRNQKQNGIIEQQQIQRIKWHSQYNFIYRVCTSERSTGCFTTNGLQQLSRKGMAVAVIIQYILLQGLLCIIVWLFAALLNLHLAVCKSGFFFFSFFTWYSTLHQIKSLPFAMRDFQLTSFDIFVFL